MAKSIRSKTQRKNRNLLRQTVHGPVEKKRLERLTLKESKNLEQQKDIAEPIEVVEQEETMQVDLTKSEKLQLLLNRNQLKKKLKARAKSKVRIVRK
jgi:hypothetical protein